MFIPTWVVWLVVGIVALLYFRVWRLERMMRTHVALVVPHVSRVERAVLGLVWAHDGAEPHAVFLDERRANRMEAGPDTVATAREEVDAFRAATLRD